MEINNFIDFDRARKIAEASRDTDSRLGSRNGACKGIVYSRAGVPPARNSIQAVTDSTAANYGLALAVERDFKHNPINGLTTLIRVLTN